MKYRRYHLNRVGFPDEFFTIDVKLERYIHHFEDPNRLNVIGQIQSFRQSQKYSFISQIPDILNEIGWDFLEGTKALKLVEFIPLKDAIDILKEEMDKETLYSFIVYNKRLYPFDLDEVIDFNVEDYFNDLFKNLNSGVHYHKNYINLLNKIVNKFKNITILTINK